MHILVSLPDGQEFKVEGKAGTSVMEAMRNQVSVIKTNGTVERVS